MIGWNLFVLLSPYDQEHYLPLHRSHILYLYYILVRILCCYVRAPTLHFEISPVLGFVVKSPLSECLMLFSGILLKPLDLLTSIFP